MQHAEDVSGETKKGGWGRDRRKEKERRSSLTAPRGRIWERSERKHAFLWANCYSSSCYLDPRKEDHLSYIRISFDCLADLWSDRSSNLTRTSVVTVSQTYRTLTAREAAAVTFSNDNLPWTVNTERKDRSPYFQTLLIFPNASGKTEKLTIALYSYWTALVFTVFLSIECSWEIIIIVKAEGGCRLALSTDSIISSVTKLDVLPSRSACR